MDLLALQQLAVSIGLGLLLGLERERSESSIAGIRTFPFISLFGTVCAQIGVATSSEGWIISAGLLAVTGIIVFANYAKLKNGADDVGTTTEFAALLLYALGALIVVGNMLAALVVAGLAVVLLHFKAALHRTVAAVGEPDMRAIMQFVLISMVILPVLPNQDYGPYEVWNPFKIWLMVVFIVAISLCGYVAYKLFGTRAGVLLGGIIGGVISSTATTVSFARRCASSAALAPLGVLVIMIASCISMVRVLIEIAVVAPTIFPATAIPLGVMLGWSTVIATFLYFQSRKSQGEMPEQKNPAEFKSAFFFGLLYALVLLGVAAANDYFGSAGLYVVSIISGLTDMDAITLSTAQMAANNQIDAPLAWRAILVATMSNFVFKFGTVCVLGSSALIWRTAIAFGLAIAGGLLILFAWPS
ncbi:MgtC/SapB family protein [Phragmitibacter flavus]|uniref:MgtC/SapB family protein n=1 Tax=Phragmitibacter flavus TaxID=2576071 RepID=A0A5R8KIS3_9BACT|nr:MgtC/SapB family protein [Phragmitibacter flavus]TLD72226.1 MgtC/SapB family protein [Phragmitibacter flavus]